MKNPAFTIISQRKYPVKVTYAKSTKKGAKRYSKSLYCKVTVKDYVLKSVKQTKKNVIEATVAGKTADLKASDFSVKNQTTKVDVLIKSVTIDKDDASKVTIETFADLTDSNDIDVTLDGKTLSFKATDETVADLSVDPLSIAYGTEKEIKMVAKDANGVELVSAAYASADVPSAYTFTVYDLLT